MGEMRISAYGSRCPLRAGCIVGCFGNMRSIVSVWKHSGYVTPVAVGRSFSILM